MKKKNRVGRYCSCLGLATGSALLMRMAFLVSPVMAAGPPIFTVNSPSDVVDANPGDGKCETAPNNGVCTLRAAIMEANHTPGGATIRFGLPGAVTYRLTIPPSGSDDETTGDLNIFNSGTLNIIGNSPANTIIDGNATDRVFTMGSAPSPTPTPSPTPHVTISGVTITNGKKTYTNTDPNAFAGGILSNYGLTLTNVVVSNSSANASTGGAYGGGIYSGGQLSLENCTVIGNQVTTVSGGIASGGGIVGSVMVTDSTISGNTARDSGGGIYGGGTFINSTVSGNTARYGGGINGSTLTLINSSISGNDANDHGGGIYHSGGTMGMYNVTIAANTAHGNSSGAGLGGGVYNANGTVNFQNTILGNNYNVIIFNGHPLLGAENCSGTLTSGGNNIISDMSDCTVNGGGVTVTDPGIASLANNGGPTSTHALITGSAAIDAGNPGGCTDNLGATLNTDQRGYTRPAPASAPCDIGAFEAGGSLSHSLGNISTRAFVGTGNNVLIGGLIITGAGPKNVILRALGPTLGQPPFNVPGALSNPLLDLYDSSGDLIISNDNWGSASNASAIMASGHAPPNSLESAILRNLDPGNYTAILRGVNNTTGVVLFEGYDLDSTASSELGNISTRAFVQTGAKLMIAGIIVKGPDSQNVIMRAIGPTLGQPPFNLPNVLSDPVLALRDANGNAVATNDNWKDTQQIEIQASGYAPRNASESAIVSTLAPGNYTAILSGKNNTTGNALVEAYRLN